MSKIHKVFLMGGEGTGWALDADVLTTRASLLALGGLVEFTDLQDADVVHSVWEWPLLRLPEERLVGKRILCHVCNDLMRTYEQICMTQADRIGLWIPISRQTERELNSLKLNNRYVPYAINTNVFTESVPRGMTNQMLRQKFGVPEDRFVISNFMRDSLGSNLSIPKEQKGVDVFLQIVKELHRMKLPVHILLAGPRRHWIKDRLHDNGVPFTYVGKEVSGDDNTINILDAETINLLYHISDLHLVTSRWEGGPRAVLEAAATRTRIVCSQVGLAPDILEPECLFSFIDDGITAIKRQIKEGHLNGTVDTQFNRLMKNHISTANVERFKSIYEDLKSVPIFTPGLFKKNKKKCGKVVKKYFGWVRKRRPAAGLHVGLWHEFHKPPYGGGNQFMIALKKELSSLGAKVSVNLMSKSVDVHICNSAWFDQKSFLAKEYQWAPRMIHRIDGPIALYRGTSWKDDERIYELNRDLATVTVFQSPWSFQQMVEKGMAFKRPVVIGNAVDSKIFFPPIARRPTKGRRIKIISTAWSDNPNKGGDIYKWLDGHLDFTRFDYTFVGRTNQKFSNIQLVPPKTSKELGRILREHDIYLTASRYDPCSNALLEALACGLPAVYFQIGGHGKLVQFGGLPFQGTEDILDQIDRLALHIEAYRNSICVPQLREIAMRYIELAFELV